MRQAREKEGEKSRLVFHLVSLIIRLNYNFNQMDTHAHQSNAYITHACENGRVHVSESDERASKPAREI